MFLSTLSLAPSHFSSLISPFLLMLHLLVVCYNNNNNNNNNNIPCCFPLVQQTAYQHGVSCLNATFSAYETLSYLTRNGNTVFQTFYDLEKTFDSVEYYVLLKHLFLRGIDGKCWWLI